MERPRSARLGRWLSAPYGPRRGCLLGCQEPDRAACIPNRRTSALDLGGDDTTASPSETRRPDVSGGSSAGFSADRSSARRRCGDTHWIDVCGAGSWFCTDRLAAAGVTYAGRRHDGSQVLCHHAHFRRRVQIERGWRRQLSRRPATVSRLLWSLCHCWHRLPPSPTCHPAWHLRCSYSRCA